jgi:tetratricopeptide (TPR) repeat protein
VLAAVITVAPAAGAAPQAQAQPRPQSKPAQAPASTPASTTADPIAEAYYQFALGHRLAGEGDVEAAIKAYKRALELDPASADIPTELAELYAGESRVRDAIEWAERALKLEPEHTDAHRVLGLIYAELASREASGTAASADTGYRTQAIDHLERALTLATGDPAASMRLTLARIYLQGASVDKAIPVLRQLLADNPWLPQGVALLSQAYTSAGRNADAVKLLSDAAAMEPAFYETLGETLEKDKRFTEAAAAYEKALAQDPADNNLKTRLAFCLLGLEDPASLGRARDLLTAVTKASPTQSWPLYLLSRAQRALGDLDGAEASARRLLAISPSSTSGAHALAQVYEARREWATLIAALEPVAAGQTKGREADIALILTHLGFAYIEVGRQADAIAAFERAVTLDPQDADLKSYLAQAFVSAKQYEKALAMARGLRAANPADPRLARLEADALRGLGRFDEGVTLLKPLADASTDDLTGVQALAEYYASERRYADAAAVLKAALAKTPDAVGLQFQYGAMLERNKQFPEAEKVFRQLLARNPQHAPSLNYLGYTLVERGSRVDEAISLIKRAVELDPSNGAYLDSLGWAYFKGNQLDLAELPLRRAADQLQRDSVVQDHWGDFLSRKGRYAEAAEAWRRALAGDGEQIDRSAIERKIRDAAAKSGKD